TTATKLTMDHVVPLARGGRSIKSNLVPCCKSCNNQKKNLLPIEWKEYLVIIGKKKE
ncbi:MAG: HNH endonuclease signature motif containing protein, partial [SAR324 cluster bacterium]|nr:HNH endonuclease signature motif containing protein [SAR324 cluster bacterium]